MEQPIVFVYAKKGKIIVLNLEESQKRNDELLSDGWVHTQTLDPCIFIAYIHNECNADDLVQEVNSLVTHPHHISQ